MFIYAITRLSKTIILRYTKNLCLSITFGVGLTILLGLSSAVIILVIVFINANSLSFKQAIAVIMGANIGTTFLSQLIALDAGKYAVVFL